MYVLLILLLIIAAAAIVFRGITKESGLQVAAGVIFAVLTLGFFWFMSFWGEVLWFNAVGYGHRFWTEVIAKAVLAAIGGILGLVIVSALTWKLPKGRWLVKSIAAIAGAYIAGRWSLGNWDRILLLINRVSTGVKDPILGRDTGFYLFVLPVYNTLYALLLVLTLIALIASAIGIFIKFTRGGIELQEPENRQSRYTPLYLSTACLLFVLAWGRYLDRFGLMYSPLGVVTGPGWTDVHVRLPLYLVTAILMVIAGLVLAVPYIRNKMFGAVASRAGRSPVVAISPLVGVAIVTAAVLIIGAGCMPRAFRVEVIPSGKELQETQIGGDTGFWLKDKIAVIEVDGVISNSAGGGWFGDGENPVSVFYEKLEKARKDDDVKAVVLRINSPGGSVGASDIMYHSLRRFKEKAKKPVVASIMDVGASGAYYLACGADGIMMQTSGITGSIGVIAQVVSFEGTMNKIGMKAATIKSGGLKDMGSPFHDMTEEERAVFEKLITSFYEQFLGVVDEGRKELGGERLRTIADGRVYTADEAVGNGLVDRIGYPQDAVDWARAMAGVEKARTVIYSRPAGYKPNIYSSSNADRALSGVLINVELPEWLNSGGAHFLYLWQPGVE